MKVEKYSFCFIKKKRIFMSTGANFATMLHSAVYGKKDKSNDDQEKMKSGEKKETEGEEILCEGCLENQPNQLAHMGINGCMGNQLEDY